MSDIIDRFLDKLATWKENFEVVPYKENGDDELSCLVNKIRRCKISSLLKDIEKYFKSDCFELPHPENSHVITFPFASANMGHCNFIFMADESKKHPWLLVQSGNFMDCFFTDTGSLYHIFGKGSWLPAVANLSKLINKKSLISEIKKNGYKKRKTKGTLISSNRPFHFFYDQLYVLKYLVDRKVSNVYYDEIFWPVEHFLNTAIKISQHDFRDIFLSPKAVSKGFYYSNRSLVNNTMAGFEDVCRLMMKEKVIKEQRNNDELRLAINISTEKRAWIEQISGYSKILEKLSEKFKKVIVFCDGMTAPINEKIDITDNNETFSNLKNQCSHLNNIDFHSIFGKEYTDKYKVYHNVDLVITAMGSSAIMPIRFARKNTVQYSNIGMDATVCAADGDFKVLNRDLKYTREEKSRVSGQSQHASYHIPWQHIYNLAVELINEIKGRELDLLDIPSVEPLINAENHISEKKSFQKFNINQKRLSISSQPADILREVALAFERIGDISTANIVMTKALDFKPKGPLISKKVAEYRSFLDGENMTYGGDR